MFASLLLFTWVPYLPLLNNKEFNYPQILTKKFNKLLNTVFGHKIITVEFVGTFYVSSLFRLDFSLNSP